MLPTVGQLEALLRKYRDTFARVVPFDEAKDRLLLMDFTSHNQELTPDIVGDTSAFSDYVNRALENGGCKYGIGGYNEHRTVYSRSALFGTSATADGSKQAASTEPRRLHLAIDIWGNAGTPVFAPLPGRVHSFAFNDHFGDYGSTIILSHKLEGYNFNTLYGHLSLRSIRSLAPGQPISQGSQLADFGVPAENGHWPPHLHFQLIIDMQGMQGDYPGVCTYAGKQAYLDNCPNPDSILGMMRHATQVSR